MKRRHFLSTSLSTTAGWMVQQSNAQEVFEPPREETVRISLLHTTDLHGHIVPTKDYSGVDNVGGFGRCFSQIRSWRKSNPHHLTLDMGDLYQGTHVSLETEGALMVKLLNAARYDAWIPGNHDFDWGELIFRQAVRDSAMPVLSANLEVDGHATGHGHHSGGDYATLLPHLVKEIAGIRLGIFGITTPGLPFWLNPGQLGSVKALDPLSASQQAVRALKDQGVDCIIACGHMGLKQFDQDDYANQVNRVLDGSPEIDVFLAGHTHRDRPSTVIGNTLFTQAGYHGIWAGRLDLTFLIQGRKLIRRDAETLLMDEKIAMDPLVEEITGSAMGDSGKKLATKVGRLEKRLEQGRHDSAVPDAQSLIAAGIKRAVEARGEKIDGVLHGTFSKDPIQPGEKTLADMWQILPYENRIVTATVTGEQLVAILEEVLSRGGGSHRLVGFALQSEWNQESRSRKVLSLIASNGQPVSATESYRIAFNSYDAQSGGRRLLLIREILLKPASKTVYHATDTRQALTDFFLDEEVVTAEKLKVLTGPGRKEDVM